LKSASTSAENGNLRGAIRALINPPIKLTFIS